VNWESGENKGSGVLFKRIDQRGTRITFRAHNLMVRANQGLNLFYNLRS
jgi:hypothetical protein